MRVRRLALLSAVLLLAATLALPAGAQEPGQSNDSRAPSETGSIEVESHRGGVRVWLAPEEARGPVSVEVNATTASVGLNYPADREDPGRPDVELILDTLIEYRDADDNGSYELREPVASAWRLTTTSPRENRTTNDTTPWSTPIVTNVTRQGVEGKRILLPIPLGERGTLFLELQTLAQAPQGDDESPAPSSASLELAIQRYDFQRNDTDLALAFTVRNRASATIQESLEPDEEGRGAVFVTKRADEETAEFAFTWQSTADVDGSPEPVSARPLDPVPTGDQGEAGQEEGRRTGGDDAQNRSTRQGPGPRGSDVVEQRFVFSYARGEQIVHEASAEVSTASAEQEDGIEAPTTALAALAVGAASLLARQRSPG